MGKDFEQNETLSLSNGKDIYYVELCVRLSVSTEREVDKMTESQRFYAGVISATKDDSHSEQKVTRLWVRKHSTKICDRITKSTLL